MGFNRPIWSLLGHYGSAIMGSASHVMKYLGINVHKGQ